MSIRSLYFILSFKQDSKWKFKAIITPYCFKILCTNFYCFNFLSKVIRCLFSIEHWISLDLCAPLPSFLGTSYNLKIFIVSPQLLPVCFPDWSTYFHCGFFLLFLCCLPLSWYSRVHIKFVLYSSNIYNVFFWVSQWWKRSEWE